MADEPKSYSQEEFEEAVAAAVADQTAGLKKNRDELLRESKRAKEALTRYDGVDPDEFRRLKAEAEEAERKRLSAEGDFKSLEKQLVERHNKEVEQLVARNKSEVEKAEARVAKALAALEKRKVATLTEALAKAGADEDMLDLLVLRGSKAIRLRETDEDWEEYVADERGNQLVADGKGTPMDIPTYVERDLKAKYPGAFKGTGSSGGGATKSTGSAGGTRTVAAGDNQAFLANLDGIASGSVTVAGS